MCNFNSYFSDETKDIAARQHSTTHKFNFILSKIIRRKCNFLIIIFKKEAHIYDSWDYSMSINLWGAMNSINQN